MKDLDEEGSALAPGPEVYPFTRRCMYCMDGGVLDLALMQPIDIDP